jgi:hypothetical protein
MRKPIVSAIPNHPTSGKGRRSTLGESPERIERRHARERQLVFPFIDRAVRLERGFRRVIVAMTAVVAVGLVAGLPAGRYGAVWLASKTRLVALTLVGVPRSRANLDDEWRRKREFEIAAARGDYRRSFAAMSPPIQELFRFAGLDPRQVVLRWGNFDRTLRLPSTTFESDESGRSYRMKPHTRSVWVRTQRSAEGCPSYFLAPDTPELRDALRSTEFEVVAGSNQTTNSWGLRGAEPDLTVPLRGIVLGDSYMQGILVADDETPPECLRRDLLARIETRVEVINTGHIGYSPEQCFFTLLEYADRVDPQFVVLSLFANDFGDLAEVLEGEADWDEGKHWVSEIQRYCRERGMIILVVPAPFVSQVVGARKGASYPGQISNIAGENSLDYLDPIEAFVDEQLVFLSEASDQDINEMPSPLFNGWIADAHFSPLGSKVWAKAVGRRLSLLFEIHKIELQPTDPQRPDKL